MGCQGIEVEGMGMGVARNGEKGINAIPELSVINEPHTINPLQIKVTSFASTSKTAIT